MQWIESENKERKDMILELKIIPMCGPRISAHAFPTQWRARFFYFEKLI